MSGKDISELILGIDPGLRVTGYGLITNLNGKLAAVEFGVISSTSSLSVTERIFEIVEVLSEILDQYQPSCASVEQIFSAVNVKSALLLGHIRGAILAELRRHSVPVHEYTPLEIKRAVVGYGRADKNQVGHMCKILLNLKDVPKPHDASDALAAAICHFHTNSSMLMGETER